MPQFNIRVYGVLINDQQQILLSDEIIREKPYTKFPGGGLEYGEGTRDCLVREFMEELQLKITVGEHLYTTDFFQLSAFHPDHQIISIYYIVRPLEDIRKPLASSPFDYQYQQPNGEDEPVCFRFVDWKDFDEQVVSLPIDKIVVGILKERFS